MFKSLRNKLSKNKKGFTLVELMIVIAIIGILAIVLIPQASKMRDNAKQSGVDSNARIVQAQLEALIDDYNSPTTLASALSTRLGSMIVNPYDSSDTYVQIDTDPTNGVASPSAVTIFDAGVTSSNVDTLFASGGTVYSPLSGTVVVGIYGSNSTLAAKVYSYDKTGTPVTSSTKAKTVTK